MTKLNEIENFDFPSMKGYKPKKKNDLVLRIIVVVIFVGTLALAWLIAHPAKSEAKTIEAKDCMTDICVLRVVCGEQTDYINAKEFCL